MKPSALASLKRAVDDLNHPERFEQQLALARKAKAQAARDRAEKDWYKGVANALLPSKVEANRHREENARLKKQVDTLLPAVVERAMATNEEIRIASLAIIKGLKDKTSAVLWTTYAEGGSVSSAAKAAGVSKGQAHKLLRRLEHEYGIPILRRTCKGDNERLTDTYIHKKGHARTIKTRQP